MVSGVVIVQMAQYHSFDAVGISPKLAYRLSGANQKLARPRLCNVRRKARVDNDCALGVPHKPNVVRHLHRSVVQVAPDKTF
jgi:hypothetical protein